MMPVTLLCLRRLAGHHTCELSLAGNSHIHEGRVLDFPEVNYLSRMLPDRMLIQHVTAAASWLVDDRADMKLCW